MRILYFSRNYTPHDFRFLYSLSKTEHEIHYLKLEANERQLEDRPVPENVNQIPWTGGRSAFRWSDLPRLVLDFRRVVRTVRPDLVHAGPIQTCAFIAVLSGFRPILTKSWGYDLVHEAEKNAWMRWVTRFTLERSDFFTSDAKITRDKAVAFGMNPERVAVFPWGVNIERFSPSSGPKPVTGGFTLFCNRTWEPIYGVDVLARAFIKVAAEHEDVNLILLGGGSQGAHIRQILMKGGVLDRVHFGGHVGQRDLPRWYQMADLYVSASHVDGSSVSLMEALASGLPSVVSDIAGNREWITDGENGWLFRDDDPDDLAAKIQYAIRHRASLQEIGKCARRTAEQKADWKRNFGTLLQAYQQVASLRGRNQGERRSDLKSQ